MAFSSLLETFKASQVIAVIRAAQSEDALWASQVLIAAGVQVIEVTFTVPGATQVIQTLVRQFPDVLVGAGTVLSCEQISSAVLAGARFLVSPVTSPELMHFAQKKNVLLIPGCATPTEVFNATQLGAAVVKLFPAKAMGGVALLRAIREPLPNSLVIPTGGITKDTARSYLQAGALAVGAGSSLVDPVLVQTREKEKLTAHIRQFLAMMDGCYL